MAIRNPKVISGLRAGRTEPERDGGPKTLHQIAQEANEVLGRKSFVREDGETVFQSAFTAHRVQITAPNDMLDPSTGTIVRGRPVVLRFEQGIARTTDPEIIHKVKGCDQQEMRTVEGPRGSRQYVRVTGCSLGGHGIRKLIHQPHPRYGIGKDFWDADEMLDRAKQKQIADVARVIRDQPEIFDQAMNLLNSDDFVLPEKKQGGPTAKPAPAVDADSGVSP
jgi:hypothetical protein